MSGVMSVQMTYVYIISAFRVQRGVGAFHSDARYCIVSIFIL